MFTDFFYTLKNKGIDVSTTEWLAFMEALDMDLAHSSLSGLYFLGRMLLVKRESDFDKYDLAFMEYFKDIKSDDEIPDRIWDYLDKPDMEIDKQNIDMFSIAVNRDANEVKRMFRERLSEQNSEHNGGNHWIGTSGGSALFFSV